MRGGVFLSGIFVHEACTEIDEVWRAGVRVAALEIALQEVGERLVLVSRRGDAPGDGRRRVDIAAPADRLEENLF